MAALKNRVERLETEQSFQRWLQFERFLEGLSDKQLEDIILYWRFPKRLPEPLPMGDAALVPATPTASTASRFHDRLFYRLLL